MFGKWTCACVQVRKCRYVYVVVVAAACLAVLAGAVRLSLAMLPRPVVRQQRKSGRGQLAERLCQITPLVLWSKALGAAATCRRPCACRGCVKRKVMSITCIICFWRVRFWACFWVSLGLASLQSCPGDAGDAGDAGDVAGSCLHTRRPAAALKHCKNT